MTPDNQPALPEPVFMAADDGGAHVYGYTAEQMFEMYRLGKLDGFSYDESLRRAEGEGCPHGNTDPNCNHCYAEGQERQTLQRQLHDAYVDRDNWKRECLMRRQLAEGATLGEGREVVGKLVRPYPPGAGVILKASHPVGATQIIPNENALSLPPGEYKLVVASTTAKRDDTVYYDRGLIAKMLSSVPGTYTGEAIAKQVKLLSFADNAEAAGVHTAQRVAAGDDATTDDSPKDVSFWVRRLKEQEAITDRLAAELKAKTPPPTGEAVADFDSWWEREQASDPLHTQTVKNAARAAWHASHPAAQAEGREQEQREVLEALCEAYIANRHAMDSCGFVKCVTPGRNRLSDTEVGRLWLRAHALTAPADVERAK